MKYPADRYVSVHDEEGYPVEALLDDEEDYQDMKDGYALRRLRAALPESWWEVRIFGPQPQAPGPSVLVLVEDMSQPSSERSPSGTGDTIAEAADKCLVALA